MHRTERSAGTAVRTETDALASRAGIARARRASVLRGWSLLDSSVGGAVAVALHYAAMQVWDAVILFVADVSGSMNEIFSRARVMCPTGVVRGVIRECWYYSSTRSLCAVPVALFRLMDTYS
jgi:hypothetical protein